MVWFFLAYLLIGLLLTSCIWQLWYFNTDRGHRTQKRVMAVVDSTSMVADRDETLTSIFTFVGTVFSYTLITV